MGILVRQHRIVETLIEPAQVIEDYLRHGVDKGRAHPISSKLRVLDVVEVKYTTEAIRAHNAEIDRLNSNAETINRDNGKKLALNYTFCGVVTAITVRGFSLQWYVDNERGKEFKHFYASYDDINLVRVLGRPKIDALAGLRKLGPYAVYGASSAGIDKLNLKRKGGR